MIDNLLVSFIVTACGVMCGSGVYLLAIILGVFDPIPEPDRRRTVERFTFRELQATPYDAFGTIGGRW